MPEESRYDVNIIRPEVKNKDVAIRGRDASPDHRAAAKKALRALHTLELMAKTIYKFQITSEASELNRQLIAAMLNEMTHYQDFQTKLYEYGLRPSPFRWAYWIVGFCFGFFSCVMGKRAILKTGVWVESKAVTHYAELLDAVDWDEPTRRIIEKDALDEDGHISHWVEFLEKLDRGEKI